MAAVTVVRRYAVPEWTGVAGVFEISLGLSALRPVPLHMWSNTNELLTHKQTQRATGVYCYQDSDC